MKILEIVLGALTVILIFISYYLSVKSSLQKIAGDAINNAETYDLDGKEKMKVAVSQISQLVPTVLKPFFKDEIIETIVQCAFDKMQEFAKKQVEKDVKCSGD